jgi:hypothetical protein
MGHDILPPFKELHPKVKRSFQGVENHKMDSNGVGFPEIQSSIACNPKRSEQ